MVETKLQEALQETEVSRLSVVQALCHIKPFAFLA